MENWNFHREHWVYCYRYETFNLFFRIKLATLQPYALTLLHCTVCTIQYGVQSAVWYGFVRKPHNEPFKLLESPLQIPRFLVEYFDCSTGHIHTGLHDVLVNHFLENTPDFKISRRFLKFSRHQTFTHLTLTSLTYY
ncbi:hypothetical protein EYC84_012149 [Monilinia fructicola]|uniref:Uncharacterized protein n=1 Tax=Monilinia fructicola TaxID=38448 RepID=A0A5M9J7D5_MONFR|nr:hypothetical protein EYC84_012149 [Monilinia fructicola]